MLTQCGAIFHSISKRKFHAAFASNNACLLCILWPWYKNRAYVFILEFFILVKFREFYFPRYYVILAYYIICFWQIFMQSELDGDFLQCIVPKYFHSYFQTNGRIFLIKVLLFPMHLASMLLLTPLYSRLWKILISSLKCMIDIIDLLYIISCSQS